MFLTPSVTMVSLLRLASVGRNCRIWIYLLLVGLFAESPSLGLIDDPDAGVGGMLYGPVGDTAGNNLASNSGGLGPGSSIEEQTIIPEITPPRPSLSGYKKSYSVGETLTLSCKTRVTSGDNLFVYIEYDNKVNKDQEHGRYTLDDALRWKTGEFDDIIRTLTITNLHVNDSGIYKCLTSYTQDEPVFSEASVLINVFDPEELKTEISVNEPPQIFSQMETVLQIGDNITIDCFGPKEVVWEFPEPKPSFASNGPVEFSGRLYVRKLHIVNAEWIGTGYYRCRYVDIDKWVTPPPTTTPTPMEQNGGFGEFGHRGGAVGEGFNGGAAIGGFGGAGWNPWGVRSLGGSEMPVKEVSAEDKFKNVTEGDGVWASKIFIYVSDPANPFQYQDPLTVWSVVQYMRPFYIQCGVTDPAFRTELIINNMNVTGVYGTSWNPRTGFLLEFPTFEIQNSPMCMVFTDAYPDGFPKNVFVIPGPQSGDPPPATLTVNKKSILSGDTLEFVCKANILPGGLVYMFFDYAAKDKNLSRYEEKLPQRESGANNAVDVISKTLIISNVQVNDAGIYKCFTSFQNNDPKGKGNSQSSIEVLVHESEFINLTNPNPVVIAMEAAYGSTMKVYVHAVPNPKIEWFFENKKLENNNNIKQIDDPLKHESKLLIREPKAEFSGIYTVRVTVEANNVTKEATETFSFYVQGKPNVTVEAKSEHDNLPAQVVTARIPPANRFDMAVSCKVRGYPPSNVSWYFQPCWLDFCKKRDEMDAWEEIPDDGGNRAQKIINQGMIKDLLFSETKKSGHYKCVAQNSYGNSSDTILVLATDEHGIQSVWDSSKRRLVKGDSLVVTCVANKWLYSSVALYRKPDVDVTEILPETDNNTATDSGSHVKKTATTAMNSGSGDIIPPPLPYSYHAIVTPSAAKTHENVPDVGGSAVENVTNPTTTASVVLGNNGPKQMFKESANLREVSLRWDKLETSDQGDYLCVATSASENKTHQKSYHLLINEIIPPEISDQTLGMRRVSIGSSTVFQCMIQGLPPPTTFWYKDGNQLNITDTGRYVLTSGRGSLLIKNASLDDEGNYQCMGSNYGGRVWSKNMTLLVGDASVRAGFSSHYIGIIISAIIVFIIILVIIIVKLKFSKTATHKDLEQFLIQPQGDYNPDLPIDEQTGCLPYDAKWEFPKDRLRLGMILGQGAFGRVMKAEAIGITDGEDVTVVAVKMVKDCTDKEQMMALLSELKILIHVGQHLNILNLLGAVTKDIRFGELYVIVEYCHFGNLRSYLIKNKEYFQDTMEDVDDQATEGPDSSKLSPPPYDSTPTSPTSAPNEKLIHEKGPYYVNKAGGPHGSAALFGPSLTTKNLFCWAFQVARGMEFLAARKYIHRDLAARNVLLSEDNIVKICDFGLAKDLYQDQEYFKKGDGPVPVKWMALESFTHRIYTTKSDVWSYGILLWELFSLGGNPYPGVEINEKFIGLLKSGYRMEKPPFATDELYKVMLKTWKVDPDERPAFSSLVACMGDFLESNVKQYYLDLSSPYMKMQGDGEGGSGDEAGDKTEESNILTDPDGYLKMSPTLGPDYSNILPNSPKSTSFSQIDETTPTYVNQRRWKKDDEVDEMEMAPLNSSTDDRKSSLPDALAPGFLPEDDNQVHTVAEIHQLEETDSGHSSSYEGAGLSPVLAVENNDYLIPVLPDTPPPTLPYVASQHPQQKANVVPDIPAPPEGPKISLASKLPPLRDAPSSSNTPRVRQPTPLRLYSATSTTAPSPMFQAAASTAPLTRSAPYSSNKKNQELGNSNGSSVMSDNKKRGSEGFVPNSLSPTTPTNTESASGGRPAPGALPKPNGDIVSPSSSSLSWANKRAGIPKLKDTSRVYTPVGANGDSSVNSPPPVSAASINTSPTVPNTLNPLSKYTAWPLPPPENDDTVTNTSQPLLNGPLRTRIGNFRNGLSEGRFLSNTSSGYNSDLSPAESTPPPDYRAVLDEL